jgi:drug/metabolite transporter (DMT)-like permease
MIVGGALLTVSDAVTKYLTESFPVGQILTMRSIATVVPLAFLAWRLGGWATLKVRDVKGQAVRAVCVVGSTIFFVTSLAYLPLATSIAIAFAAPLIIVALAPLALGERLTPARLTAVAVGFLGVLVIIRPGGDSLLGWASLLPLGSAVAGSLRDLITRRISATESSVATFAVTIAVTAFAGLFTLPFGWVWPTAAQLAVVGAGGLLLGFAHFLLIETFRLAEATLVAPLKYTTLVSGIVLGFAVFGDIPDAWMLLGSALVVAGGLLALRRG